MKKVYVTMSNGVQQTEVKLNTQTTQFKPVANYTQSDQVDFSFPPQNSQKKSYIVRIKDLNQIVACSLRQT